MAFLWIHVPQLTGGAKTDKVYALLRQQRRARWSRRRPRDLRRQSGAGAAIQRGQRACRRTATAYKNNPSAVDGRSVPASLIAGGARSSPALRRSTVPASREPATAAQSGIHGLGAGSRWSAASRRADVLSLADGGHELTLGIDGTAAFARLYRRQGARDGDAAGDGELSQRRLAPLGGHRRCRHA